MAALPLLLASASGFLGAVVLNFPGIVLAWMQKRGQDNPTKSQQIVIGAIYTTACIACGFIMIGASASGGSVSIIVPVNIATCSLGNMVVQNLSGLSTYTKNMRMGTIGLTLAVLLLIDLGPKLPPKPSGFTWQAEPLTMPSIGIFIIADAFILVSVLLTRNQASNSLAKIISIALLDSLSNNLALTSSRFMGLLSGWQLSCAVISWLAFSALTLWGSLLAGTGCDMSIYVPVEILSRLSSSMLTGLLIWGDSEHIENKFAYFTCFLIILVSVYVNTEQLDVATAAGNAYKLSKTRLSEGRAHGPIGRAALDMIQSGAPKTPDEVTAFKDTFRRLRSCSVRNKLASVDDIQDLVDRFITFNGERAPHVVVDWIEGHHLYEKYCWLDPEFKGVFRHALLNVPTEAKTLGDDSDIREGVQEDSGAPPPT